MGTSLTLHTLGYRDENSVLGEEPLLHHFSRRRDYFPLKRFVFNLCRCSVYTDVGVICYFVSLWNSCLLLVENPVMFHFYTLFNGRSVLKVHCLFESGLNKTGVSVFLETDVGCALLEFLHQWQSRWLQQSLAEGESGGEISMGHLKEVKLNILLILDLPHFIL